LNPPVSGSGWRWPALAVVVGLLVLVGVARLGMKEAPTPPPSTPVNAVPTTLAGGLPSASLPASLVGVAPSNPPVLLSAPSDLEFDYSPWPDRYADGIPRVLDGTPVLRLNAAVDQARLAADGRTGSLLVGGWFQGTAQNVSGCSKQGYEPWCSDEMLADTPALLGRAEGVTVSGMPGVSGPAVARVKIVADCGNNRPPSLNAYCQFRLTADRVLWQGDEYTSTSPIAVGPLISAIAAMMWFDPIPFHPRPSCQLTRPAQSYTTTYGNVEMMFAFASTEDRVAQGADAIESRSDDQSVSGCARVPPLEGSSGWISQDNVLIRVVDATGVPGRTIQNLLAELSSEAASQ
jgi:hypothetical protein